VQQQLSSLGQVNMWNGFDAGVPFGGYKTSGIGREKGEAALSHYTQVCIMLITEVKQLQNDNALHIQTELRQSRHAYSCICFC